MRERTGSPSRPYQPFVVALLAVGIGVTAAPTRATPAGALAKGKFLVATNQLQDPHFAETVVLLVDYGPSGAIGLVINRPSDVKLRKALPDLNALRRRSDPVHLGGPVSPQHILLLVRADKPPPHSQLVFGSVYLTGSIDTLKSLVAEKTPGDRMRAYAGYAGWAPTQLDYEIERGDWNVLAADAETIFVTPTKDVWPQLHQRGAGQWAAAQTWPQLARPARLADSR